MKYTIIERKKLHELQQANARRINNIVELQEIITEYRNKITILEKTVAQLRWNEKDWHGRLIRNKK